MSYVGSSLKEVFEEEGQKFAKYKFYMALGAVSFRPCRIFLCNSLSTPDEGQCLCEEPSIRLAINEVKQYIDYLVVKESQEANVLTLHIFNTTKKELKSLT